MTNYKEYAFVLDAEGKRLAPTKVQKAWYKIRHGLAYLVSNCPMVIKLTKVVNENDICKDDIRCGIDDGGLYVGISLVQKCRTRNKVLFKGTIEHRRDVKRKIDIRRYYRSHRRYHKRYREKRFRNRASSRRDGRVSPSILQKRQTTIRFIRQILKWVQIRNFYLEDVKLNIRALVDGYKPYNWQYQKSNRLDENIRKAVMMRDGYKCAECGDANCSLQIHHIKPRRLNGSNTMGNLISLCKKCHSMTYGKEELYMDRYFSMISGGHDKCLNYAQQSMIGKTFLRKELSGLGPLHLTSGCDTFNKRIDWGIDKSHSNDAICITDLYPDNTEIRDWYIIPIRKKPKSLVDNMSGFRHRDFIEYKSNRGTEDRGYVTALYPKKNQLSFTGRLKVYKRISVKSCRLLWRADKFYWFDNMN